VALAGLVFAGCRVNPVTGTREFMLVPESQEVQLGHRNHPDIIFMYDGEYHDPELNRYLGTIVMRLHEVSHRPEMPMEFTMLNTSVINAFATPAHVYATRGFLARLENEAQFAAVMGHELTHVAAGHSAKRLSNNLLVSLAVGAADLAVGESGIGQLAVGAGQAGITLLGLSYSRDQERQADRVGTYYMALAGWEPQQSITMQKLLQSFNEREPTILDRYLSTHPMSDDRVQQIRAVIQQKGLDSGYVQGDGVYEDRWDRRVTRLRQVDKDFEPYDRGMEMLSQKRFDEALGAANQAIANRDDQAPFFRLKGDALLGLGMTDQAKTAYRQSLQVDERYVLANIGLGRAYLAEGNQEAAEREFEKAARDYPGSATALYGLGTARFNQRRYEEAILPLQNVAAAAPGNPQPHYMLAVSYDKLGETARAYEAYQNALAAGLGGEERVHAETRVKSLTPTR
jgi:predicted Zn-dependent protease